MKYYDTQHGTVEVVGKQRVDRFIVRFIETGSTVVISKEKLEAGTVVDPLKKGFDKWTAYLHNGDVFQARNLNDLSKQVGQSVPMLRKVICGEKKSTVVRSIVRK